MVVQRKMVVQAAMAHDARFLPLLHLSCLFVEEREPSSEVFVEEQGMGLADSMSHHAFREAMEAQMETQETRLRAQASKAVRVVRVLGPTLKASRDLAAAEVLGE